MKNESWNKSNYRLLMYICYSIVFTIEALTKQYPMCIPIGMLMLASYSGLYRCILLRKEDN
jgi:hypothetical protein